MANPMAMRCSACREVKEADQFNNDRSRPSGKHHRCRSCTKQRNKGLWQKERGRQIESAGPIAPRCEICGAAWSSNSHVTAPHWDHNHETGDGRGWLCQGCNAGLGNFGDNPSILRRAAEYLSNRGHGTSRPVIR